MSFPLFFIKFLLILLKYIETTPAGCCNSNGVNCKSCCQGYYESIIPNTSFVNCEKCQTDNCLSCSSSPSSCSSCNHHYYFVGANCVVCSSNCYGCLNSAGYCTSCSSGDYLSGSTCYHCDNNCKECVIHPLIVHLVEMEII